MKYSLVTGGAGFIGSHLVRALCDKDYEVTVIDDFSTGSRANLKGLGVELLERDIASITPDEYKDFLRACSPDVVFHLAAQSSISHYERSPQKSHAVNVGATKTLFEACTSRHAPPHFIFASSAAVYGDNVLLPTKEDHSCRPFNGYGHSKLEGESILGKGGTSRVPATALRFSNVYGPGQTDHGEAGVVTKFMGAARDGKPLTIYGTGDATRDFVYVGDVVHALIHAYENKLTGTYNVSTERPTTIKHLADLVVGLSEKSLILEHKPSREGDVLHSRLSNARLRGTGWEPRTTLEDGLRHTWKSF